MCEEADHNIYRTHTHSQTQSLYLISVKNPYNPTSLQMNVNSSYDRSNYFC